MKFAKNKRLLAACGGALALLVCGGAALIIRHKKEAAA